jgi:nicotinamidase-related amidase
VHGLSSFHDTELKSVLREQQVGTAVITGVSANAGIPRTCLKAVERGFTAVVCEGAVAGSSREIQASRSRRSFRCWPK